MNKREFMFSVIPGLEQDLNQAKESLKKSYQDEFESWKKENGLTILPDDVLWELFQIKGC